MVSGLGDEDYVGADEVAEIRTRSDELERWLAELERGGSERLSRLSETERRIVELARAGHTDVQIAQALFVSAKTVEWSRTKIVRKLRADGREDTRSALLGAASDARGDDPNEERT